ncbi:MAG: hypothetical protein ACREA0_11895 [bacterium]
MTVAITKSGLRELKAAQEAQLRGLECDLHLTETEIRQLVAITGTIIRACSHRG